MGQSAVVDSPRAPLVVAASVSGRQQLGHGRGEGLLRLSGTEC